MRTRAASFTAAICAALALWLTRGTLAVIGPGIDSPRVGLLEPAWHLALFIAAAAALTVFARSPLPFAVPFFATALAVLPWLPVPVPAAFTLWTGHAAVAVWVAAIILLIAQRSALRERLCTIATPAVQTCGLPRASELTAVRRDPLDNRRRRPS